MSQRIRWHLGATAVAAGALLLACTQQPGTPQQPAGGATTPIPTVAAPAKAAASTPATSGSPAPATKAASPAPATKAASPAPATKAASPAPAAKTAASPQAAARPNVTPKGTFTFVWHTAIAPTWWDPQENGALITPYAFDYLVHDAVMKPMPGNVFTPSLAESFEVAPDFRSATIRLRPNLKFHNGEPVTSADVKWTYENYKGANATILKEKTASVETPDDRTVRFTFKEPFLDFQVLYGTPASGAGWIVPAKYYQQVGPDGFKQHPIGAGPFKFVRQSGADYEFEAFEDYWRHAPYVKTLHFKEVTEASTRLAQLQTGEADIVNLIPGQLLDVVRNDPNLQLTPVQSGNFWFEFPGYEKADNPFHDKRVRQAVSLALNRQAYSEAEEGGLSILTTNWVPEDWPGAIKGTVPEYNVEKAKQLMQEAGKGDGFEMELTPLPPYTSAGERFIGDLREIGIRGKVNVMERGAFTAKVTEGVDAFPGPIINASGAPGDAASRIRAFAICDGASSRTCDPEIDNRFKRYEASTNPQEREQLLAEIQRYIIDNYIFVSAWRQAFISAQGPRVANAWDEVRGAIPQYVYVGPYEEIKVKD